MNFFHIVGTVEKVDWKKDRSNNDYPVLSVSYDVGEEADKDYRVTVRIPLFSRASVHPLARALTEGDCVSVSGTVYYKNADGKSYRNLFVQKIWRCMPETPDFALHVIHGRVTKVGGQENENYQWARVSTWGKREHTVHNVRSWDPEIIRTLRQEAPEGAFVTIIGTPIAKKDQDGVWRHFIRVTDCYGSGEIDTSPGQAAAETAGEGTEEPGIPF